MRVSACFVKPSIGRPDRLSELNAAIGVLPSSRNFKESEASMLLALLSLNISPLCRLELEESVGGGRDLVRFQRFVLKVGAEMTKHSRRLVMRIAESTQPRGSRFVERLQRWALPESHRITTTRRSGFMPPPQHSHLSEVLRW